LLPLCSGPEFPVEGELSVLIKHVTSPFVVPLTFAAAVASVSVAATSQALVPGGAPLSFATTISGSVVTLTANGGTDGERYTVTVRAVRAGGEDERELTLFVLNKDWTMPDGSAGWLDLQEFVARFGLEETIAATDDSGDGTIDRAFLIAKLIDAQAEVEANVAAAQYVLPLAVVPAILKTAIADLARSRLYRRGVPDEVAENAKVQRRLLERIARGDLPLPLPAGVTAARSESSVPVTGWTGRAAYPDNLAD
jgi:phage gp36-like protein